MEARVVGMIGVVCFYVAAVPQQVIGGTQGERSCFRTNIRK